MKEVTSEQLGKKKEVVKFDQAVFRPLIDLRRHNPEKSPPHQAEPDQHF